MNSRFRLVSALCWGALAALSPLAVRRADAVGTIEGTAYHDLDGNGQIDGGEPALSGWTIELIDSAGSVVSTRTTDGAGAYSFPGLADGGYVVRQVPPSGYTRTEPHFATTFTAGPVTGDWGYIDAPPGHPDLHGPARWGDIAPDANGFFQSPIDLDSGDTTDLSRVLTTHYVPTEVEKIFNNGHTIEAEYPHGEENFLSIGGEHFDLLQFHFHATSENAVDGSVAAMEAHFVHAHHDGGLSVIGVFLEPGAFNPEWDAVFHHMGDLHEKDDEVAHPDEHVNAHDLMPDDPTGWWFEGSLTTPPASQPVNWFVFATPVEVSQAQIDAYILAAEDIDPEHDFNPGNRPLTALNGRQLNEQNHEVTLLGGDATGVNFGNVAVPEPATMALLGPVGLAMLGRRRWR